MIYVNRQLHPDYNIDPYNFHKLIPEGDGLLDKGLNHFESERWRETDVYKNICLKLYEQGVNILKNWNHYVELADEGKCYVLFSQGDYKTARYRQLQVYAYVFAYGFEHFLEITKKYGHSINGTEYIISNYKEGVYFEVNEPFEQTSYLEHLVSERKWWQIW